MGWRILRPTAGEWLLYGGVTVAGANPECPLDAPVIVVVAIAPVERYLPEWDGETSLSRSILDEAGVYYTTVPAPCLFPPTSSPTAMRTLSPTLCSPQQHSQASGPSIQNGVEEPQEESPLSILFA